MTIDPASVQFRPIDFSLFYCECRVSPDKAFWSTSSSLPMLHHVVRRSLMIFAKVSKILSYAVNEQRDILVKTNSARRERDSSPVTVSGVCQYTV